MELKFLSHSSRAFGCFSNFSAHPVAGRGVVFPTAQHYFQAMKFHRSIKDFDAVRKAATPFEATQLGNDPQRPLRDDWEKAKQSILLEVLKAKFEQHKDIAHVLRMTRKSPLIFNAKDDDYWGVGPSRNGRNIMGQTLMQIRTQLQEEYESINNAKKGIRSSTDSKTAGGDTLEARLRRERESPADRYRLTHTDFL